VLRWPPATLESVVWPVVSRLVTDADETVRARALFFIDAWQAGDTRTVPRLIDVASTQRNRFTPAERARVAGVLSNKTVSSRREAPRIAAAMVAVLANQSPPAAAVTALAEFEPEFLIAAAGSLGEGASDQMAARLAASAIATYRRDRLLALLGAFVGRSREHREEILGEAAGRLAITDENLRRILVSEGLPQPRTKPTVKDCRRALALAP
jgi:hypothetical protein